MADRITESFPRLIYNSDGDSTTLSAFPAPITPEQACRDIEEIVDTGVDVFTNSIGRGDETLSHRSEFAEVYGENVDEWPEDESLQWIRRMADNTRTFLDAEIDILDLLAERAHDRGLGFWPALRMNDNHEDDTPRFGTLRSTYKKEHPELLIGASYPRDHPYGPPKEGYTWCFDFARPEVRERKLGLILETCEKHDVDGFEMNFQRGPWYFKDGEQQAGLPLMTDFVRAVRSGTRAISERKGRPLTLMARVPPTVEWCLSLGLDAPTWIEENLVDLIVPMDSQHLDMGAEVRRFADLARGTECRIGGGLEHRFRGYGSRTPLVPGPDMLYAGALSYWHQGASFIYLFNYDCHRTAGGNLPYEPAEIGVLERIGNPSLLARENKRYWVTSDILRRTCEEGGAMPLPLDLTNPGDSASFTVWVGDDIESARHDNALSCIWLRFAFTGFDRLMKEVATTLNGDPLIDSHWVEFPGCTTVVHRDVPAVQGPNEITVALPKCVEPNTRSPRLESIELVINYR